MERALADAFSLEHPDVKWTPPPQLPSAQDIRAALAVLKPEQATPKHAGWCLAKLTMAFEPNTKLSPEESKLRAAIWLEANADLGDELWSKATLAAIRSQKWMPKPAEFRELVATELAERAKKLTRCQQMLAAKAKEEPEAAPAKTIVPKIDQLRKLLREQLDDTTIPEDHRQFNAANTERSLALFEKRRIEPWARDVLARMPSAQPSREDRTFHAGAAARSVLSTMTRTVEPWAPGEPVYQTPATGDEPPPHDAIPE